MHYVSPSVWAYRQRRIVSIKRAVDLMLTLFPFEQAIYRQYGIPVRWVGHPLADQIDTVDRKADCRTRYALPADAPVVALLPGSRVSEIDRLAPLFLAAAVASLQPLPRLQWLLPCSGPVARARIERQLAAAALSSHPQFHLVDDSHSAMAAADLVLLASGTATLEAMLLRRPMVVSYKLAALTYLLASRMVKVPYIALPNLLANQRLVPEYLQQQVTVPNLRREIVDFFQQAGPNRQLLATFDRLHHVLRKDAAVTAALAIRQLLETR